MTLRRPTSCGEKLRVVAIKTLKGSRDYFLSPTERQQVANALFNLLSKATCPTVVLGNIGFELASYWKLLREYDRETKSDLESDLQVLVTEDQGLMSLFRDATRPITGAQTILIEANAPKRMMIIRLDTEVDDPLESQILERVPCTLTPRIEHFLKLLQTPSCEEALEKGWNPRIGTHRLQLHLADA